jgi:two-component system, LuxR family, response regulator FixJ
VNTRRSLAAVVDDEAPVRTALKRLLRSAGFAVETFSSGTEFLESLESRRLDCLVLDLNMPRFDGFAVQARLIETNVHLPMVVLTGYDTAEARKRALAGGASCYLRKPTDDERLLSAITDAIAHAPGTTPA